MLLFLLPWFLGACASSRQPASRDKTMQEYEQDFDPSRYAERRQKSGMEKASDSEREQRRDVPDAPAYFDRMEKVLGYRLQVYSTTSVDDASNRREYFRSVLDSMQIDLVYSAPYYKLRLGNFRDRADAESFKTELQSRGINDAWIVRDHIYTTRKDVIR